VNGIVAIASGKGGVGKTFLAASLAHALRRAGRRVLLIDAGLGLANLDVQLGLTDTRHLGRALAKGRPLVEAVVHDAGTGLDLLLGPSGWQWLAALDGPALDRLVAEFATLASGYDTAVLDLPAGIGRRTLALAGIARRALLVVSPEPTALTDAYALVKVGLGRHPGLAVLANMADDATQGIETWRVLATACRRFLAVDPPLLGVVRRDPRVVETIARQQPVLNRHPGAPAALDIVRIARSLLEDAVPGRPSPCPLRAASGESG
jgi:flagellar biosynthesis protein FlhG